MIDAARTAVGSIKAENISELRSFKMPPDAIRDVLEGVLLLMGKEDTSWNGMKQFLGAAGGLRTLWGAGGAHVPHPLHHHPFTTLPSPQRSITHSPTRPPIRSPAPPTHTHTPRLAHGQHERARDDHELRRARDQRQDAAQGGGAAGGQARLLRARLHLPRLPGGGAHGHVGQGQHRVRAGARRSRARLAAALRCASAPAAGRARASVTGVGASSVFRQPTEPAAGCALSPPKPSLTP